MLFQLISRRAWLGSLFVAGLGSRLQADELNSVRERGRKAGLNDFQVTTNQEFQAIGDAPARFRTEALDRCDRLAKVYRDHFTAKGFEVAKPAGLLTVVTLKSPESFAAYSGRPVEAAIGGFYDVDANELVMFDLRQDEAKGLAVPVEANNLVLIHEATHQLCYNRGLLSREGDVPLAISEGLGCYGETWRYKVRNAVFGGPNPNRTQVFGQSKAAGQAWIPLETLLADDSFFADETTQQLAYAESWTLVHSLLNSTASRTKFKSYLQMIGDRKTKDSRVADAQKAFGDLTSLDKSIQRAAKWIR